MKNVSLLQLFVPLFLVLSLLGCLNEFDDIIPDLEGVPAGGVADIRIVQVEGNTLELELTCFAVDHFGSFISGLGSQNFSIFSNNRNYAYRISNIEEQEDEFIGPYSAALLFDQSGSIVRTDPDDDRILSGTSFVDLLANGDEAAVAAFSGGGNYQYPYELLVEMGNDKASLNTAIESLAGMADGNTPLYQSIYNLMPYVSQNSGNENKAIIAFTDGQDTQGGVSIDDIVERACATGVKVYTVGLSNGVDESVLSQIAVRTDGAVMLAEDALQLVSLYRSLGELLQGTAKLYKMTLTVENTAGNWRPGNNLDGVLNLNLSEEYPVRLPFGIGLTPQNAGTFNQREPECACSNEIPADLVSKWKEKAQEYLTKIKDPSPFNQNITCAYVDIYYQNPNKFKWAGLAALVSEEVGTAPNISLDFLNLPGYLDPIAFFASLEEGNQAVFQDLIWQHLAFDEAGIVEIEKIYCAGKLTGQNYISLEVYRGWLKISTDNPDLIFEGNRDILYHEQLNVLQPILYDPHPNWWEFLENYTNLLDLAYLAPFIYGTLVSPVPGHNEAFPYSNIDVFRDRWRWLEESVLPEWKEFESDPTNTATLRAEHQKDCPNCCN